MTSSTTTRGPLAALEPLALSATQAAALACQAWVGAEDPMAADADATAAMRTVLDAGDARGTVVIGEGTKDAAPMLFNGEQLGTASGMPYDIAVDPLEGTGLCASGRGGALTTIAFAEAETLAALSASFYMDKLVGPASLIGVLDISAEPEVNLARAAETLGRDVSELRVVVLDKPRHATLISRLRAAGAEVMTPSDGDVAGALSALLPDGSADLLMGIGGTPEGVMTACAVRALGGFMQAQLAPQRDDERAALTDAGLETTHIYESDELVAGEAFFVATGVTDGPLLRQPRRQDDVTHTDSIVISAGIVSRIKEAHA
jgi:fructose-1,6-bisphosphatase II